MNSSQIESTINEIRKHTVAVTAFNAKNFPKVYGKSEKPNHTAGQRNFGESYYHKNLVAIRSKNIGRFLLNEKKIQSIKVSALNPLVCKD